MLELNDPWMLIGLVLIAFLGRLPAWQNLNDTLWYPSTQTLVAALPKRAGGALRYHWSVLGVWVALSLLVVGLTEPSYIKKEQQLSIAGRDIVLVLDTSQSMQTMDIVSQTTGETLSRLTAVKRGLDSLFGQSEGGRLGLIAFGEQSFVVSDLTAHAETVRYMANQLETGFAGDSTRLGDALGYAVSLFSEATSERAVIVLVTDGNDTGSDLPPLEAARLAKALNVKLYVAAVGAAEGDGREPIDEELLGRLVERTGGEFFRITTTEEFDRVWGTLESKEPIQQRAEERVTVIALAWMFWMMSLILLCAIGWLVPRTRIRGQK